MAPFPSKLIKEIQDFHPGLSDDQIHQYTSLVYRIASSGQMGDSEAYDKAVKERDAYVEKYLPHLNEAMESYEKKVEQRFKDMTAKDPVEVALESPPVIRWMAKNLKGIQYDTSSRQMNERSRYIVEFKSLEGPELHVAVDIYSHDASIVFQRIKTDKGR